MGGLIMAGTFTNAGDLPIAYVTTLASGTLFTTADSAKGIAYCVIFLTVFVFSLFNLGGFRLIERDFKRKTEDIESGSYEPERKNEPGLRSLIRSIKQYRRSKIDPPVTQQPQPPASPCDSGSIYETPVEIVAPTFSQLPPRRSSVAQQTIPDIGTLSSNINEGPPLRKVASENITDVINAYNQPNRLRKTASRATTTQIEEKENPEQPEEFHDKASETTPPGSAFKRFIDKYHLHFLWEFIKNFRRPPSAALIIAIIVAMIPQVRRLFYDAPDSTVQGIPNAPDGAPIFGFVMDFTSFVGNAAVPFGLAMLGATMARLSLKKMPTGFWKSVILLALLKLAVLPIIAVAWTHKMKELGWIAEDNHMALFVMLISSGVPCATSQVYLTAIFMPKDSDSKEMDCLAACLICQYAMLVFTMTILLTYTLKNVLGF